MKKYSKYVYFFMKLVHNYKHFVSIGQTKHNFAYKHLRRDKTKHVSVQILNSFYKNDFLKNVFLKKHFFIVNPNAPIVC